ncbi:MAG: hypothetical protein J6K52_08335 [Clostridia bacterium]|nr:hypothetical protein [Clostridia bacterium]MBQ7788372.1 hypothetical protein [Clostridia bacterium]
MEKLIKAIDELPWIVKLLLCIPALDIVWAVYRLCKSLTANNTLGIVLAILCIFPGAAFVWLVDIICVLVNGKIWWLD